MKKVYYYLRIFVYSIVGVYIGSSLFRYWDYKNHKSLYLLTNVEPWYESVLQSGILVTILCVVCVLIMMIIRGGKNK